MDQEQVLEKKHLEMVPKSNNAKNGRELIAAYLERNPDVDSKRCNPRTIVQVQIEIKAELIDT